MCFSLYAHSADLKLLLLQTQSQSYKANYTTDISELRSKLHYRYSGVTKQTTVQIFRSYEANYTTDIPELRSKLLYRYSGVTKQTTVQIFRSYEANYSTDIPELRSKLHYRYSGVTKQTTLYRWPTVTQLTILQAPKCKARDTILRCIQ
jgi:hypothetical protein